MHPFFGGNMINIGVLTNTHGLRGEVKIKSLSDFTDIRFAKGTILLLLHNDEFIPLTIQNIRETKGMLIVKFLEYDNINQVECLKGDYIVIDESNLHELEEDEAYFFELMDCQVKDMQGNDLGVVVEVIETGANAVLRVRNQTGNEILIPYVKAFVKKFNKEQKEIQVEIMEGLV